MESTEKKVPMMPILINLTKFKSCYSKREEEGQCSHSSHNKHIINMICMQCELVCCGGDFDTHFSEKGHYIYYNLTLKVFKDKKIQDQITEEPLAKMLEQYKTAISEENKDVDEITSTIEGLSLKSEEKKEEKNAKYERFINKLKNGEFTKIAFLTGAGLSTSAGIPDFRSSTGLFKQLQEKYSLSTPEEFFNIKTFLEHPKYFYEFCKEFNPEDYQPTPTHYFMGFLCHKGYVEYVFTQNIDGLDLRAGIPHDKIIFAHGNFLKGHCPTCKIPVDIKLINESIKKGEIYYCSKCEKPCKQDIVFYGENLNYTFFEGLYRIKICDLAITAGTSLKVHPFAQLPYEILKTNWRVSINRSKIGETDVVRGFKYDKETSNDLFISGQTDEVIQKIIEDCGWTAEFQSFISETKKHHTK